MNYETLETEQNGGQLSARRETRSFIASGTISTGDIVCFDITQAADADRFLFVKQAHNGDTNRFGCIGVALHDASADDVVEVVIAGGVKAKVDSGVQAGNFLALGANGECVVYGAAYVTPIVAFATEDYDANGTLIWFMRQY